jgi:hypothetical protein
MPHDDALPDDALHDDLTRMITDMVLVQSVGD